MAAGPDQAVLDAVGAVLSSALSSALSSVMEEAVSRSEISELLEQWEQTQTGPTEELVSILSRVSEVIERETREYLKSDPDPFDDRHPARADPNCALGQMLKVIFANEELTNALLDVYMVTSSELSLNTAACRLFLNILPGLETSEVFQEKEDLIGKLFTWATEAERPLAAYAAGLLATAMRSQDVVAIYREQNARLVPLMISRLRELHELHELSDPTDRPKSPSKNTQPSIDQSTWSTSRTNDSNADQRAGGTSRTNDSNTDQRAGSTSRTNDSNSDQRAGSTSRTNDSNTDQRAGSTSRTNDSNTDQRAGSTSRTNGSNTDQRAGGTSRTNDSNTDQRAGGTSRTNDSNTDQRAGSTSRTNDSNTDQRAGSTSRTNDSNTDQRAGSTSRTNDSNTDQRAGSTSRTNDSNTDQRAGGTSRTNDSNTDQRAEQLTESKNQRKKAKQKVKNVSSRPEREEAELANSGTSWSEMCPIMIGSEYSLSPLNPTMEQRLILQYLTPLGDVQELLAIFMQMETRTLLMDYIDLRQTQSVQLTFDALSFLASLLLHKKFAREFIDHGGIPRLLDVPRPSMAATGVSLCLNYLAYSLDLLEWLSGPVLSNVVSYALWLLESSHASGVCHATMFFSMSFSVRAVLLLFDLKDGLRRLVNLISTLDILNVEDNLPALSDDQVFSNQQTAKITVVALYRYFEAHLAIKVEQVKQQMLDRSVVSLKPLYKAETFTRDQVVEMMEFLMERGPPHLHWEPAEVFHKLSCVPLMLQLLSAACDWRNYSRSEVVRYVLDVLAVLTVVPKIQLLLADTVEVLDENRSSVSTVGMSIILGIAEGEVFMNDAEVQKSALQVIINCVCAQDQTYAVGAFPVSPVRASASLHNCALTSPHSRGLTSPHSRGLAHMWQLVQNNNGIKVLLSLLSVKTPITDADRIRALACKALVGLARSSAIRQIISKLPLFSSGQIQQLMKEPVLQDKYSEHVRFCRFAEELTECVSGKPLLMGSDVSLARLQRASVVARSRITFSEKELLVLIGNHLVSKGLVNTADLLTKEANLHPGLTCPSAFTPTSPFPSALTPNSTSPGTLRSLRSSTNGSCRSSAGTSTPHAPGSRVGRILFSRERPTLSCPVGRKVKPLRQKSDHGAYIQTPAMKRQAERHPPSPPTLDGIVTEYLREQHARCANPVTTCPPFSLFTPHRCPEPKHRRQASPNFTRRLASRVLGPKLGGVDRDALDRHLMFSRFRPMSVFHEGPGDDSDFTCCAFSARERFLMLGTCSGHLKLFNVFSSEEAASYSCHTSSITHLQPSRDGKLLLTSASWGIPQSALWSLEGVFSQRSSFVDDHYVEFSKLCQDRVIGTQDHKANIYDIQTGQRISSLYDAALANNYKKNCATFDPTDELVLNDGVLWDVRAAQAVHKFDKFNTNISGVFHPNALEVIVNTEIWDLRTFHLLRTVPALDQCRLIFNSNASIIYGVMLQADDDEDEVDQQMKSPFGSSFRTFDATDYKPIATVDVKRSIFDLCADSKDCYVAVIESQDGMSLDTVCRLYEVGRQKLVEEGDDEEEDEEERSADSSDMDDTDDDDMDTDPMIEELIGDNNPENDESPDSPTEEEIARLLEDEENDGDNEENDDNDSDDSEAEQLSSSSDEPFDWLV